MKYYKHLYLSEEVEKKKDKIIQKIEAGKILPGIFLAVSYTHLTLPTNSRV